MAQSTSEKQARIADLAGRYTAAELARLVTDLEDQLVGVRVRLGERGERLEGCLRALHSIARREWTADGAVRVAQEALDA